jgi:hypothetical protein
MHVASFPTLATTLLDMVQPSMESLLAQPVDLMEHNLQTATRAPRGAGEPEEVVVASKLLHLTESILPPRITVAKWPFEPLRVAQAHHLTPCASI